MDELSQNLANREIMLSRLRAEVVGPDPAGKPVTLVDKQAMTWEEFRAARMQANGEEIVWQDPPIKRYGAGILFPLGSDEQTVVGASETLEPVALDSSELLPEGAQAERSPGDSQRALARLCTLTS